MRPDKTKEYKYWLIPSKNKFSKPIDIVTNDYGDEYFKYKQNGKEKYLYNIAVNSRSIIDDSNFKSCNFT